MTRRIEGLRWARKAERPPGFAGGRVRLRGWKQQGVLYEKAVAGALPEAEKGTWWEFEDQNGLGWCQTDLILVGTRSVLVLECKLSATADAWVQLEGLYQPVVRVALGLEVVGMQVAKVIRPGMVPGVVVGDLVSGMEVVRSGRRPLVHWKGLAPLWGGFSPGSAISGGREASPGA